MNNIFTRLNKLCCLFLLLFTGVKLQAQNVGIGTAVPETPLHIVGALSLDGVETVAPGAAPAITTIVSTVVISNNATGGDANALTYTGAVTPAAGQLMYIYNSDDDDASFGGSTITSGGSATFVYLNGGWRIAGSSAGAAGWGLTGNGGTNPATNYLGTSDAVDFVIGTNAIERARINSTGYAAINTAPSVLSRFQVLEANSALTSKSAIYGNATNNNAAPARAVGITGSASQTVAGMTGQNIGVFGSATGFSNAITGGGALGVLGYAATGTSALAIGMYAGISANIAVPPAGLPTTHTAFYATGENLGYAGIFMNGSVGIGTTLPTQRLHVSGGSVLTDRAYAASTVSVAANTAAFNTGANAVTQVRITDNASGSANGNLTYGGTAIEGQYLWITNSDAESVPFASTTPTTTISTGSTVGFVYTGGAWRGVSGAGGSASGWGLTGNAGTTAGTNFIGTTDDVALIFKTNGQNAGRISNSTGSLTFFGYQAGNATVSNFNSFFGTGTGAGNTYAEQNVAMGSNALRTMSFANGNVAWATNNTAIGFRSMFATQPTNTTNGYNNTAVGAMTLEDNTTGSFNVALGSQALANNTTGIGNLAAGYFALNANTNGQYNVALGAYNLQANLGGQFNIAIGQSSLAANQTGNNNVSLGSQTMQSNVAGGNNIALGSGALFTANASDNVALGGNALQNVSTGASNVAVGRNTGLTLTVGSSNTLIGHTANVSVNNLSNATAIGANASVGASNSMVLGNNVNVGIGISAPLYKLHVVSATNTAVFGTTASTTLPSVYGQVTGTTGSNSGVSGVTFSDNISSSGVIGQATGTTGAAGTGVTGLNPNDVAGATGVYGYAGAAAGANTVYGVWGQTETGSALGAGVYGYFGGGTGLAPGVYGQSVSADDAAAGVFGENASLLNGGATIGVWGRVYSDANNVLTPGLYPMGVFGEANAFGLALGTTVGVSGQNQNDNANDAGTEGINWGLTAANYGTYGLTLSNNAGAVGAFGWAAGDVPGDGMAPWGVFALGDVGASGVKTFHIDHPLDPENKYLNFICPESPEALNMYSGNVTTDANGDAIVTLPDYVAAVTKDFRYTLTPIGQFASVIVAEEFSNNQFKIKSDKPNVKVSWMLTGVRNDPYMQTYDRPVEEMKDASAKGKYLVPALYGQPNSKSLYRNIDELKDGRAKLNTVRPLDAPDRNLPAKVTPEQKVLPAGTEEIRK